MEIVKMALEKTKMIKFSIHKKKPCAVNLSIRNETFEIVCNSVLAPRPTKDYIISFSEIKEIRKGKNSKDFENSDAGKKCDSSKCFVLFHGNEFRLKTLSICVQSDKSSKTNSNTHDDDNLIQNIIQGLEILKRQTISYPLRLDIWILKSFETMSLNGLITLKQMTNQYMNKISLKMSMEKLTENFEKVDEGVYGIKFHGFSIITKQFLNNQQHNEQIFTDCFGKYSLNATQISKDGFEDFLSQEQDMAHGVIPPHILNEYFKTETDGKCFSTIHKVVNFLFSKENQVWNTKFDKVYQDMTHPLSHYWIASSHNTYLTGDQFTSESSVEAYVRALRQGCRCIEIDCFDGGTDGPVIYHGRTFTTKILFADVLVAIRDHAFATSEYPVIISIENHCSIKQQKIMAKKFIDIFGNMLVKEPIHDKNDQLPSPEDLKRRIILKGRKLLMDEKEKLVNEQSLDGSLTDLNLSDAKKTGKMYLQNESKKWEPFFFALMANKLQYTAIEEPKLPDHDRPENSTGVINDELHFKETWFHGDISGGTKEAEKRVQAYNIEGCFLVRNSTNCPGEYSVCLMSHKRTYHLRIQSKFDYNSGLRLFYLDPIKTFDSLYHLITYYRKYSLDTQKFTIEKFTTPVSPPDKHESEPWFHKNIDRSGAEKVLANIPITGAFLVRYAGEGNRFAISFRIDKLIKHCQIYEDGRLLMVNTRKFETISDLINYYHDHTFYKWVKLSPPVTAELKRLSGDSVKPKARAIRDFVADDIKTKLSLKRGDIINNVDKIEGDFWRGDLGYHVQKLFPKDFVEIIDTPESPFGSVRKGSVDIGDVQKVQIITNPDKAYPFKLNISCARVEYNIAVTTEDEAKEWEEALNEVLKDIKTPIIRTKKSLKKSKIACELSQLIVYGCKVSKRLPEEVLKTGRTYNQMISFSETVGEKLTYLDPKFFVWFTQVQLTRIFPMAIRFDSSNFNPSTFWNVGAQLIALNYQTPEKYMQVNRGKFRQNGNSGYVLKPNFLLKNEFNPNDEQGLNSFEIKPLHIKLTIISGRHVYRAEKGIMSPFVEIEIVGASFDCRKVKTQTISDNGLNPFWNDKFNLEIKNRDLALIRFSVQSEDMFGDSQFIGEATYPVTCLLPGYRSVPLLNGYGEELLAVLLIHLKFE